MSHLGNKEQNIGWSTWITILIKYKIRIQKNSFILFPKGHLKSDLIFLLPKPSELTSSIQKKEWIDDSCK